jgi:hypothetical protein
VAGLALGRRKLGGREGRRLPGTPAGQLPVSLVAAVRYLDVGGGRPVAVMLMAILQHIDGAAGAAAVDAWQTFAFPASAQPSDKTQVTVSILSAFFQVSEQPWKPTRTIGG